MNVSSRAAVLADVLRPGDRAWRIAYSAALVVCFALLIAVSAQIFVPLAFTPVPVTLQTLTVLLAGVLLGSRRGAAAALTYVAGGALGLPLFAAGGAGLARLAGPTGGYLLGFIAAAFVTGWLAERGLDRQVLTMVLAMLAGTAVIYACGLPWLALYVGADKVLALGLLPFIPGAALKILVAAAVLPALWKVMDGRAGKGR